MNNNTPHKPRKSRHAKRHAAAQTEPFGFDELETRSQEFRNDRRLRGAQQANADWVAEPLDEWLSCLDAGNTDLGRETMAAFAVGMRETLSIRDALILSLFIDESRCPKSWLMEFAARPHLARTRTRMGELLTCAFEDEGMMPDKERCHTGIGMLLDIAEASPVPYCIQPLAVIAYTLWWLGDPRAMVFALRCLLLDEDCSLAAMIFSAAERGVAPAWCSG